MGLNIKDKVAVVTGGAGGIGFACATKLVSEGCKVVIADVNEEVGAKAAEELTAKGGDVIFVKTNVASYESVTSLVDKTVEKYGRIDVMFNNAGIGGATPLLQHEPTKDYDRFIEINQKGVYYGILAASKKMVELNIQGVIINTASVFGMLPGEFTFAYNATKAAVISMTQSAAMELGPNKIRVVAIAPGRVNTPILDPYKEFGVWDQVKAEQMRNEFTEPEEIGNIVAFLASELSNSINGSTVKCDDGYADFKAPLLMKK